MKELLGETYESKAVRGGNLDITPSVAGVLIFVGLIISGNDCDLLRMFHVLQTIALNLVVRIFLCM